MKNDPLEEQLEALDVPTVQASHYEAQLEGALRQSFHGHKKTAFFSIFSSGGKEIMRKRKFAIIGAALAIAILALAAGAIFLPKTTTTAYAQQIVQKSYQAVSTLTPEQQQVLQKLIHTESFGGPLDVLKQAQSAKDLTVLTYDQFVSQYPGIMTGGSSTPGGKPVDMHKVRFLQFTDTDGNKDVLGVDQNGSLPVFVLSMSHMKAGSTPPILNPETKGLSTSGSSSTQGSVNVSVDANSHTITVNGQKYTVPAGTNFTSANPPIVDVKDGDVYINGVKAVPEK